MNTFTCIAVLNLSTLLEPGIDSLGSIGKQRFQSCKYISYLGSWEVYNIALWTLPWEASGECSKRGLITPTRHSMPPYNWSEVPTCVSRFAVVHWCGWSDWSLSAMPIGRHVLAWTSRYCWSGIWIPPYVAAGDAKESRNWSDTCSTMHFVCLHMSCSSNLFTPRKLWNYYIVIRYCLQSSLAFRNEISNQAS